MPLTRDFKETIRGRLERDPGFREALLEEGVNACSPGTSRLASPSFAITSTPRSDSRNSAE